MKQQLNKDLESICKKNKLVGANILLFDSRQILYSYNYGYGNKERQIKSDNHSLYMIGSNTKVLTAICIFKLMEEGALTLEDDIKKFIPEFEVKAAFDYDKITIGNLLMHRGGLVGDLAHLAYDKTRDFHDITSEIKHTWLTARPGTMYAYSNVGYTLLGIIIERASGRTYQQYIRETIAKPLGVGIHFLQTAEERKPFEKSISLCYNRKGTAAEDPLGTILPAGSNTYMSISDFAKIGQLFLKKDGTILKKETLDLMQTLEPQEDLDQNLNNAGYGLIHNMYDFGEEVGKILGHGGNTVYHHSIFNYIPKQNIGVAVFTNSEQAPNAAVWMAMTALFAYLKEKGIEPKKHPVTFSHIPAPGDFNPGIYATPLGVCDFKPTGKGELTTKIKGFSVKLKLCEDGFWQSYFRNPLLHLTPMKGLLKGLRLKFSQYQGEDVLIIQQGDQNNKSQMIVGCRYKQAPIPTSFQKCCGRYQLANVNNNEVRGSCRLSIQKNRLILDINLTTSKGRLVLKPVSENLAFVQGFGRSTRNDVTFTEEQGTTCITWCGLVFILNTN